MALSTHRLRVSTQMLLVVRSMLLSRQTKSRLIMYTETRRRTLILVDFLHSSLPPSKAWVCRRREIPHRHVLTVDHIAMKTLKVLESKLAAVLLFLLLSSWWWNVNLSQPVVEFLWEPLLVVEIADKRTVIY